MLRSPKRLPQRFNRPITPHTRALVERRHKRSRQYSFQRWQRMVQRVQRRAGTMRKIILQFAVLIVSGLLLLGVGLVLFSPILHIREIHVSRSDPRIDAERIQGVLAPLFGDHLFFLSPQDVVNTLDEAIPDMREVTVTKEYPSTLRLKITLDQIIAALDIQSPDGVTGSGTFAGSGEVVVPEGADYLTSKGVYVVYQQSQVESGSGQLQLIVTDWGVRPEPWRQLIDEPFLLAIRTAEEQLRTQFGIGMRSRTVYIRAREFHLKTPTHSLWFDLRSPLDEQLMRYRAFMQSVGSKSAREYVDLRLKDKIVYK
jgi:hypothetical protein